MERKRVFAGLIVLIAFFVQVSNAVQYNLTSKWSSAYINSAYFFQYVPDESAGTGVFDTFVRIQNKGIEHGYNTDGILEFDTKDGSGHTHSLLLSAIPIATYYETDYREFKLDLNESLGQENEYISLDEMKIHIADQGDLTGYDVPGNFPPPIYDLDAGGDNWIKMDYSLNKGSGQGDVVVWVPSDLFGEDETKYVYLYSKFGVNFAADAAGFEEWGVGEEAIPEPATLLLLGSGGLGLLRKRRS